MDSKQLINERSLKYREENKEAGKHIHYYKMVELKIERDKVNNSKDDIKRK